MDNEYIEKNQIRLLIQDLRNKTAELEARYKILLQKHEVLIEEHEKLKEKYINLVK